MVQVPVRPIYDTEIPVGGGPEASSAGFSQIGAAASSIAGTAQDAAMMYARAQMQFDERAKTVRQNGELAKLNAQALLDLQTEAQTALEGDPARAEASFTAGAGKALERYRSATADPEVWRAFEARFPALVVAKQLDVRDGARKRTVDAGRATLDQTLATLGTAAAGATTADERNLIIAQAKEAIQGAVAGGLYWPEKAGDLERSWLGKVDDVDARRAIMSNPARAAQVLAGSEGWGNLAPERRQTLWEAANRAADADAREQKALAAQAERDRKEAQSWEFAGLLDDLESGKRGEKDIALFEAETGFVTAMQKKRALDTAQLYEERRRKATENVDRVRTLLAANVPLDPAQDRKGVDQYWRLEIAPKLTDPAQVESMAVSFAGQTGMLPEDIKGVIVGSIRGPNVEQKVTGAALLSKIEARSPAAAGDVPDEQRRYARLLNEYIASGATPKEAVERVDQQTSPATGVMQQRREALTAKTMDAEYAEMAKALRSVPGFLNDMPDPAADPAFSGLSADYANFYRPAFEATGDAELARSEAIDKVRRTWGVTTVDGNRRWLKYAPEVVYGVEDRGEKDAAWIGEQLRTTVAELPTMKGSDAPRLILQPDQQSWQEYRETGRPKYSILQVRDGVIDAVIGPDGQPFRWAPSPRTATDRTAALDEMRARSQSMKGARDVYRDLGTMSDEPARPGL